MRRSNRGSRGSSHNRMNYAYATLPSFRQELFYYTMLLSRNCDPFRAPRVHVRLAQKTFFAWLIVFFAWLIVPLTTAAVPCYNSCGSYD